MRGFWKGLTVASLVVSACASPVTDEARLIIKFKDDSRREVVLGAEAGQHRVTLGQGQPLALGAWVYPVRGAGRAALLDALLRHPEVEYAEWDDVATTQ